MGKGLVIGPQGSEGISWQAAWGEDPRRDIDETGIGHGLTRHDKEASEGW